ncbi:trypsin-like peptidase domain-containing protein [Brevundimonas viscosa]|uniref:Do/DeqQ family serine protease n=1 Tax=Brevundimonas viscosa TaxID=871741 RepID=A0A1I6RYG8_9CAUL|nr:trypsin-like peptidase domain-containing protein [Brevundimonas viscosa]SFS69724.1 Do/DeqQ family serine protease [Brevundimonas viscosa]
MIDRTTMKTSSLAIAIALTLAACGQPDSSKAQDGVFADNRVVPGDATSMKASFAPVVREAAPAVVNISARGVQQVRDPFWGIPGQRQTGSIGSGVIVRPDGVVVTNNHVVENMQQIRVTLNDRREFPARVVLADERSDIAVLQLEGVNERLPILNIDDREEQQVGDLVLAIGNPFGVGQTVTNGIISALNRTETGISDSSSFIQTDAAINPGNSGGALVDMDGDLIGINTAIFSRSGSSSGVGFAVPATMVRRVVDSAVGGATAVVRPWLGVKGETVTADIARSLGLERPQGLVVTEVWPNGPGARAGIRQGDVITAIDGAEINDQGGLNFRVGTREPNETVQISVLRDGRVQSVDARVQRLPGDADPDKALLIRQGVLTGAQVLALNPALADSLGGDPFTSGVIVGSVNPRGYAARFLARGDLILAVNGRAVTNPQQLENIPRGAQITLQRRGQQATLLVR